MKNALKLIIEAIRIAMEKVSWNTLKDRPFYDSRKVESFVYEFDGNVEGKETVTMHNSPYVKVSDIVFPVYTIPQAYVETFSQCKFVGSDELYVECEIFQILDLVQNQLYGFDNGEFSSAYVVLNDVVYEGVSLSKGVYVAANKWGIYTSKFRVVVETGELKKLDKKYIPDDVGGSSVLWLNDIPNTPENTLMLEEHFKAGNTIMCDYSNLNPPYYSKVVMCTREYDDATGDNCVVFYSYNANGEIGASWRIL